MADQLFDSGEVDPGGSGIPQVGPDAPLAARMRPVSLDEVVGQDHILAPGTALRGAVDAGRPHSAILYGPPGSGKTTLARIIAATSDGAFEEESAVNAGRAEIRAVIARAEDRQRHGRRTVLFLDEIHRFNKAQQDALLPAVESGVLTLIGATTENPYFEVNSALISRSQIYELKALGPEEIRILLERALADSDRGVAGQVEVDPEALGVLSERVSGDARAALSALERLAAAGGRAGIPEVEDALQAQAIAYDKGGDHHYDYISAWIKATRGSDPDASLYYLAVMIEGGEDPRFIARRMVILASEDIGNADPQAIVVATAAAAAVDRVGMPEAALNLAQAATYLALAPKSNASYAAINAAREEVKKNGPKLPPAHLRDSHYPGAKELGRGEGYVYPHDVDGGVSEQSLMPEGLEGLRFYEPTRYGFESELARRQEAAAKIRGKSNKQAKNP
ncbi:MAG TPA: replication-associated recombination protein A [Solirubrobacterales bacterium]|nr:replication-associated recombination protein A [Solirubrobacterales bacterium]